MKIRLHIIFVFFTFTLFSSNSPSNCSNCATKILIRVIVFILPVHFMLAVP